MPPPGVTVCDQAHEELDSGPDTWLHWSVVDPVATGIHGGVRRHRARCATDRSCSWSTPGRVVTLVRPSDIQLDGRCRDRHWSIGLDLHGVGWRRGARHRLSVVAVIGSGIMASHLSPSDVGLQFENARRPPAHWWA